jgi:hypothetical protein
MIGRKFRGIALLALLVAMIGAGCGGSSSSGTNTESTVKPASAQESIRGEGHLVEVEGGKSITRATCLKLREFLVEQIGEGVEARPRPKPERFSECDLETKQGLVVVYLDSTVPVRARYLTRVNGIRKGAENPNNSLHPIQGIGEGLNGEAGAYWLPSIYSLYAYQPDGWMTLLYTREKETNAERRAGAEALARYAFELTGQK